MQLSKSKFKSFVSSCVFALLINPPHTDAQPKDQAKTFYTCEPGFRFESGPRSARCVKPKKEIYRPTLPCTVYPGVSKHSQLKIDALRNSDLCLKDKNSQLSQTNTKTLLPKCPNGYELYIKRGKDSCRKTMPGEIKPPVIKKAK
ncbi:hypothetical protein FLL45_08265 [Aliikangiella marina]|uniref:Uncharacterized protein n=1 Tax=Aliikangiella marina TaxID=1712262 RepID=A0A545TCJ5_9GAMM|nr:hypothetical protein [Aliikangiella marina]TQV74943.1 hypothetical protein FLL45_08265 [Aliikangiella marina]